MPVLLGVHGGSYTHGDSSEQVPNVEYFVQRGWVGFSINYRLCHQGPMLPPGATTSPATLSSSDGGNLVCGGYGSFPAVAPFGNVRKPTLRVKKQKAKKNPRVDIAQSDPHPSYCPLGAARCGSFSQTLANILCFGATIHFPNDADVRNLFDGMHSDIKIKGILQQG